MMKMKQFFVPILFLALFLGILSPTPVMAAEYPKWVPGPVKDILEKVEGIRLPTAEAVGDYGLAGLVISFFGNVSNAPWKYVAAGGKMLCGVIPGVSAVDSIISGVGQLCQIKSDLSKKPKAIKDAVGHGVDAIESFSGALPGGGLKGLKVVIGLAKTATCFAKGEFFSGILELCMALGFNEKVGKELEKTYEVKKRLDGLSFGKMMKKLVQDKVTSEKIEGLLGDGFFSFFKMIAEKIEGGDESSDGSIQKFVETESTPTVEQPSETNEGTSDGFGGE